MIGHHWLTAAPARRPFHGLPDHEEMATQKPRPDRSLAIALENVTPEAVAGAQGNAGQGTAGQAPRVVASGRGEVAEQILQIAFERGVKVRSDSDLAEILAAVEVESEIPLAALAGVAEILRYLYQTDGRPETGGGSPEKAGQDEDEEKLL